MSRAAATPWSAARRAGRDTGGRGTIWWLAAAVIDGVSGKVIRGGFWQQKLRDNGIIARRTPVRKRPFCSPQRGWLFGPGGGFPADSPPEEPSRARDPTSGRRNSMDDQSIGIHSNGMGIMPMECIRNGMDWYAMH